MYAGGVDGCVFSWCGWVCIKVVWMGVYLGGVHDCVFRWCG